MPWRTLCGFPPTSEQVSLRIPNGAWRPDTVITDNEGNEMFVLLDQTDEMRSYEAVFGDLEGRRLVCIKRHLIKAFWRDGYYFCTYRPNYLGQRALTDRDIDNKKVYPHSYVEVNAMKGRFFYRLFDNKENLGPPRMMAENPWLGFMVVCCTPVVRLGKWTAQFRKATNGKPIIYVDQWRNVVEVGPGTDLLAALCMAYIFDRSQCQPLVTVFGREEDEEMEPDDGSIESKEDDNDEHNKKPVEMTNLPDDPEQPRHQPSRTMQPNGDDDPYNYHDGEQYHEVDLNNAAPHGYHDDYNGDNHSQGYYDHDNYNQNDYDGGDRNNLDETGEYPDAQQHQQQVNDLLDDQADARHYNANDGTGANYDDGWLHDENNTDQLQDEQQQYQQQPQDQTYHAGGSPEYDDDWLREDQQPNTVSSQQTSSQDNDYGHDLLDQHDGEPFHDQSEQCNSQSAGYQENENDAAETNAHDDREFGQALGPREIV